MLTRIRNAHIVDPANRRDEIGGSDIEKLFNCSVNSRIPNDYFSLHRAVTLGQPVDGHCELGKAIEGLAGQLSGNANPDRKKAGLSDSRAVLSTV